LANWGSARHITRHRAKDKTMILEIITKCGVKSIFMVVDTFKNQLKLISIDFNRLLQEINHPNPLLSYAMIRTIVVILLFTVFVCQATPSSREDKFDPNSNYDIDYLPALHLVEKPIVSTPPKNIWFDYSEKRQFVCIDGKLSIVKADTPSE